MNKFQELNCMTEGLATVKSSEIMPVIHLVHRNTCEYENRSQLFALLPQCASPEFTCMLVTDATQVLGS